ncbi:MAG TPA: glutamate cyclase domain-containing protein [Pirellulales bacterium]|nr:glutamate cyclase domain-containing protein [Pirellulales bacterium]
MSSPPDPPLPDNPDPSRPSIDWAAVEGVMHCDPAGRGLASFRHDGAPLDAGQLRIASLDLAQQARRVGIVTGFCARVGARVTAETDGPPGALYLAQALVACGVEVVLITDGYALPLLAVGCRARNLDPAMLVEFPFEAGPPDAAARLLNDGSLSTTSDRWIETFWMQGKGRELTHLIAIERPGPSHTFESLEQSGHAAALTREQFSASVDQHQSDACHNMRGENIHPWTAKTHRLFEWIDQMQLPITTIGIGDGGNEIGMGHFAWQSLVEAIASPFAAAIACRIATDFALIAGVSNWAAYALALCVSRLRGIDQLGNWSTTAQERALIEQMVGEGGAVDGLTLRPEPTVDGLPLDVYLRPLDEMRQMLGFDAS